MDGPGSSAGPTLARMRTTTTGTPGLRICGPTDLLEAVPYLLGFHPERSLVLVGLDRRRLVVTARMDLDDVADEAAARQTLGAMVAGGATTVVAAVYDDSPSPAGSLPWRGLADDLQRSCQEAGAALGDVLLASRGRWWSLACSDPECCPAEGTALPERPSAVAAAATYAGLVALPDRGSLAAMLEPADEDERQALRPYLTAAERACAHTITAAERRAWERRQRRALMAAARSADDGTLELDAATAAEFGVALRSIAVRDALWTAGDTGRIDGRNLWQELARRLPPPYDTPPLFLFGWSSWRHGNGALANIACDLALAGDPSYSAADLLLAALTSALDPRRVPRMRMPRGA